MKSRLEQHGCLIKDSLIDALEYGVPQSRERAIAIGFKSNLVPMESIDGLESQFP
ncbi:DNA cytosine methyltransferase [Chamaesiphon sp.]|uniref:DNA cytosine methyltransferase n=1 Tax=Chamaesiphon sp. TaxID=2814140 RepID=UPI003593900E